MEKSAAESELEALRQVTQDLHQQIQTLTNQNLQRSRQMNFQKVCGRKIDMDQVESFWSFEEGAIAGVPFRTLRVNMKSGEKIWYHGSQEDIDADESVLNREVKLQG